MRPFCQPCATSRMTSSSRGVSPRRSWSSRAPRPPAVAGRPPRARSARAARVTRSPGPADRPAARVASSYAAASAAARPSAPSAAARRDPPRPRATGRKRPGYGSRSDSHAAAAARQSSPPKPPRRRRGVLLGLAGHAERGNLVTVSASRATRAESRPRALDQGRGRRNRVLGRGSVCGPARARRGRPPPRGRAS